MAYVWIVIGALWLYGLVGTIIDKFELRIKWQTYKLRRSLNRMGNAFEGTARAAETLCANGENLWFACAECDAAIATAEREDNYPSHIFPQPDRTHCL